MITNDGKLWVKQFLPGGSRNLASTLVVGVGSTTESVTDTKLSFEIARVPIDLIDFDYVNNLLVFKGALPASVSGKIYEIGLFTQPVNTVAGGYGSKTITDFNSDTETWTSPTWDSTVARIGVNSLRHAPAASGTVSSTMNTSLDLSGYSGADKFVFAYNVGTANTSTVRFRFQTDGSNYYDFNLGAQTGGYKIVEAAKGTATVTGTPNWNNITQIVVTTASTAGGASSVDYDGIRIEDVDSLNPEYLMLAREVVSPITKELGIVREIEYGVPITV